MFHELLKGSFVLTSIRTGKPMLFNINGFQTVAESVDDGILRVSLSDSDVIECYGTMDDVLKQYGLKETDYVLLRCEPLEDTIVRKEPEKTEEEKEEELLSLHNGEPAYSPFQDTRIGE